MLMKLGHLKAKFIHSNSIHQCHLCDKKFRTKFILQRHLKTKHEKVQNLSHKDESRVGKSKGMKYREKKKQEGICYTCGHCEYKTFGKQNLKNHVESIHIGVFANHAVAMNLGK